MAPLHSLMGFSRVMSAQPKQDLVNLESVRKMEAFLSQLEQVDLSTANLVHGGMCARTILIPAGTALVGALTNRDSICVMYGDTIFTTDEGAVRKTGYHVIPANAGYKRGGVAITDTYWTAIWPTSLTDIIDIENEMTDESAMLQTRRALPFNQHKALEK